MESSTYFFFDDAIFLSFEVGITDIKSIYEKVAILIGTINVNLIYNISSLIKKSFLGVLISNIVNNGIFSQKKKNYTNRSSNTLY